MRLGNSVAFVNNHAGTLVDRGRRGRAVAGTEIDLRLIRKWLGSCEEHHPEGCMPKPRAAIEPNGSQNFLRLIDVHSQCIVDAPESYRYLALSYVWGLVPTVHLRKANRSQLMSPSGLTSIIADIPQTIKDAMELVSSLGEQYLWVDSLCLIQDDEDDVREEIQTMDSVYECSYLTIIAASGADANAGLLGVRQGSRTVKQVIEDVKPDIKMVVLRQLDDYLSASKYSSRGWT
jgi:Heterokaryon incompatibility protein (HET)